jgi:hypothetical protein
MFERTRLGRIAALAGILSALWATAAGAQMSNTTNVPPVAPSDTTSERSWQASAAAFVDYDSNIGLTEEDAPPPYQYEGGLRAGLSAAGSWRALNSERFEAGIGGFLAQTTTQGDRYADEYDLTSISPRAFAAAKFSLGDRSARVQLDYAYRRDWLEGDDFERRHASRISMSVALSERITAGVHYGVDLKTFDASGFHILDARRDAEHHRTGAWASWRAPEGLRSVTVGYEFLRNLAEVRDVDFEGHGISGRFRTLLPTPFPLGLELLASYTDVDYVHYTTSPQREARTQFYRAALALPITPRLVAETSYAYLKIGADQGRFRSERHLVSASLSYRFQ